MTPKNSREREAEGIRLVVGLGNPGRKYAGTRHNIGFLVLERLVSDAGAAFQQESRWKGEAARVPGGGDPVTYLKPQTFMNLSGQSVAAAARYFKLPPEAVLVVHDDADLPFGQIRFREKGSAGGHNGIKSILSYLGTDRFPRLKLGVGRSGEDARKELADHVLGKFAEDERPVLENYLDRAADAVRYALAHGVVPAMNAFNRKPDPTPPAQSEKPGEGGGGEPPARQNRPEGSSPDEHTNP